MSNEPIKQESVPEPASDLQERVSSLNKDLKILLGKYELGLGATPKILADGRLSADPVIVDVRKKPETQPEPPGPKVEGGLANSEA